MIEQHTGTAELIEIAQAARTAARRLVSLSTSAKNAALLAIADAIEARQAEILEQNRQDVADAEASGMNPAMVDRLLLTPDRLKGIAADTRAVAALDDPVGEIFDMTTRPNGLQIGRRRVPLGVIGAIYESRPNVTVDISALAIKSGNAVILRGGKEAQRSNAALGAIVSDACRLAALPEGAVGLVRHQDRALVGEMLKLREYIDLMIPRGGAGLVRFVEANATMSVLAGGYGVCHTFVDRSADLNKACRIAHNAKVRRPTVCNALDTLIVHADIAPRFLPQLAEEWGKAKVEMRCDDRALAILQGKTERAVPAKPEDFGTEFLAYVAAVRVVDSLDEALEHIERHGSGHSEAIVTEDYSASQRFLREVDAAAVYVNASTQFTDGAQFGLGAEVGISTQKMHARGPMGLRELTTYKWIILGDGQVRPA